MKRRAILLICKRCPAGRAIRRRTKAALKAGEAKRTLRVSGCSCLDVCPKSGAAALLAIAGAPARGLVIDHQADGAALLAALLNEGVRDAVAD